MRNFKKQLEKELNEMIEDVRYYDVRGMHAEACAAEAKVAEIRKQLMLLKDIIKAGEGNLILFNANGTFTLWCIRTPEGEDQLVEMYNVDLDFENYEELLETADCMNVTDIFDTDAIAHLVVVTDTISDCMKRDVYYFVSNETIETALLELV